jgi:hypothetical protein
VYVFVFVEMVNECGKFDNLAGKAEDIQGIEIVEGMVG